MRLSSQGYKVEILEKHHKPGGRLNQLKKDGFTFDIGPSFFSMSYEFDELFRSVGVPNPLHFNKLNPLYAVFFAHRDQPYKVYTDLKKLALEFPNEANFENKARKFLEQAGSVFRDVENRIVKRNFDNKLDYAMAMATVPLKHGPLLFRSVWSELSRHFQTDDVKVIFSLVAFFLGATPFDTPAVYSLLNYIEMVHDGYWNVEGGMYRIVEEIVKLLEERGITITYNTEVTAIHATDGTVNGFLDQRGRLYEADVFVCNGDAAAFRGTILNRKKYSEEKLDEMEWTLAPFTIYLGTKGKIDNLHHHSYFLGSNFKDYAGQIFRQTESPEKPYYYVNVRSKSNPESAPEGCENLFILCPVPDLRHKKEWHDAEELADSIIDDLGKRIGFDLKSNTLTRTVYTPETWRDQFNLYKGSGLGLAHGLMQVGGMRPSNKDELFENLYYVGASTIPGTGLPIVVIGSKLVTERINHDHPIENDKRILQPA